jgi:hypothetical protein
MTDFHKKVKSDTDIIPSLSFKNFKFHIQRKICFLMLLGQVQILLVFASFLNLIFELVYSYSKSYGGFGSGKFKYLEIILVFHGNFRLIFYFQTMFTKNKNSTGCKCPKNQKYTNYVIDLQNN